MFSHERIFHPDNLAKHVAAFFEIPRSSLALFSSALNLDTFALRDAFSPLPAPGCSYARRTQSYRLLSDIPSRLATSTTP